MAEERQERARLADGVAVAERRPGGFMAPMVVGAVTIAGLYFARPVLEPLALAALLEPDAGAGGALAEPARSRPGSGGQPDAGRWPSR